SSPLQVSLSSRCTNKLVPVTDFLCILTGRTFAFFFFSKEHFFAQIGDHNCNYCWVAVTASEHHLKTKHLRFAITFEEDGTSVEDIRVQLTEDDKMNIWQTSKIQFSSEDHLRDHEKERHGRTEPVLCVKPINDLYVAAETIQGAQLPNHV
ncbi:hypothetical protein DNTS_016067, partial [Danionella cerebrum]